MNHDAPEDDFDDYVYPKDDELPAPQDDDYPANIIPLTQTPQPHLHIQNILSQRTQKKFAIPHTP